ncbi:MAG: tetratricopeptide repeat protein [Gammaproteobacteria bacterium]|nr:tetratricopeptide repeat protein [Gammaproteobacteria bacterium]
MANTRSAIAITALLMSVLCANVQGQSVTIFGGNSLARDCYRNATMAVKLSDFVSHSAIEPCDTALEHGDMSMRDRAATFVNRGIIYANMQLYTDAVRDYEKALKMRPDFAETYINRGNIFFLGRAYLRAIEDYTTALEKMSSDNLHVAYLNRGMAYERIGDAALAEQDYRRALELSPGWTIATDRLGKLLSNAQPRKDA